MYNIISCIIACLISCWTDQIPGTKCLRVIRILFRGRLDYNHKNRLESNHKNLERYKLVRYPVIEQWDDLNSGDLCTTTTIPAIQKLTFIIPHERIFDNHHYGNTIHEAFKSCGSFQYFLCHHDYLDQVVGSFANQIRSKYYGGIRSVSIEGIASEKFSASKNTLPLSSLPSHTRHAVFHHFLSCDRK